MRRKEKFEKLKSEKIDAKLFAYPCETEAKQIRFASFCFEAETNLKQNRRTLDLI